jgi:hypothetical protein
MDKIRTQLTNEIRYSTVALQSSDVLEFLTNYCDFLNIRTLQAVLPLKALEIVFYFIIMPVPFYVHVVWSVGALAFDMEYARWLEEHNKHVNELRLAVNAHAGDNDLRGIVGSVMAHYDEFFRLKGVAARSDVFHVLSGMWKTPAERCFMWLGGFRSSEVLKVVI